MNGVYNNIDDYNSNRYRKSLILSDDMIADIMTNKRFQAIIKEPFIRCIKLNMSLVFIIQSYFSVPKEVRLNSTHYSTMKIHNKKELQIFLQIIQQTLIIKALWIFTENVQVNYILFWLLMLHYLLIIT